MPLYGPPYVEEKERERCENVSHVSHIMCHRIIIYTILSLVRTSGDLIQYNFVLCTNAWLIHTKTPSKMIT